MAGLAEVPERPDIAKLHDAPIDIDQAFVSESREEAADGLELQSKEASDLRTRHAQDELAGGIAARLVSAGEVKQERTEPLLRVHGSEHQHHVALPPDL